jgi:hypothetical protein
VISAISVIAVLAFAKFAGMRTSSPVISDTLFFVALINSAVLAYQFLDKRFLLLTPKLQRRVLLGMGSVLISVVPAFAIVVAIVGLFTIR